MADSFPIKVENPDARPAPFDPALIRVNPLSGVRFARFGESRVGFLLAALLTQQGASERATSRSSADIVIDDGPHAALSPADIDAWRASNPGRIWLRFTDFPPGHPRASETCELNDAMIHAEVGLNRMGNSPVRPEPLPLASAYGAIWGAIYIGAALFGRSGGRVGVYIETPLFSAALTVVAR